MRTALIPVFALLVFGCNGSSPTEPSVQPPPSSRGTGTVTGFVHDQAGVCVPGVLVEVIDGPRAGATFLQGDPCGSVWDYSGGYSFSHLPANQDVRLRASKKGYVTREKTFHVTGVSGSANILLERE